MTKLQSVSYKIAFLCMLFRNLITYYPGGYSRFQVTGMIERGQKSKPPKIPRPNFQQNPKKPDDMLVTCWHYVMTNCWPIDRISWLPWPVWDWTETRLTLNPYGDRIYVDRQTVTRDIGQYIGQHPLKDMFLRFCRSTTPGFHPLIMLLWDTRCISLFPFTLFIRNGDSITFLLFCWHQGLIIIKTKC